jgi:hypothetical protein
VRPHSILQVLAAAALIAVPALATAAPDQNTPGNNGCNGRWVNGQCVPWNNNTNNNNGQYNNRNNGRWNTNANNDRDRERERQRERERWEREHQNGAYNNGQYNNGGYYNNGQYNNGGYYNNGYGGYNNGYGNNGRNGSGQLTGTVSSFSPYNLYLSNGLHVELHNGTVINPTGTNLTGGQQVRIIGYRNQDGTYTANEIDVIGNGYNNGWNRR